MKTFALTAAILSPLALLASCGNAAMGDSEPVSTPAPAGGQGGFKTEELARFDEPWAAAFAPGTSLLFVTERAGTAKFLDIKTGESGNVTGVPKV